MKNRRSLTIIGFFVLEAILIFLIDQPISEYLRGLDKTHPLFISIFRTYTDLGKSIWYLWPALLGIILCAGLLRVKGLAAHIYPRLAKVGESFLFLFTSVGLAGILTDIIKPILGRARPIELAREGLYGFHAFSFGATWNSMPSGHATTAFALAFVLIALFPPGRPLWLMLAVLLAISRVMVNAHYLSDVVAGGVVGWLVVYAVRKAFCTRGMFQLIQRIFPIDRKNTLP